MTKLLQITLVKKFNTKYKKKIDTEWYGEQPVGTSISVTTDKEVFNSQKLIRLIHTPTMRSPEVIVDPRIVYQCMRTTLIEAEQQNVHSIVIPAFGGLCGQISLNTIAYYMHCAYKQLKEYRPHIATWKDAIDTKQKLQRKE